MAIGRVLVGILTFNRLKMLRSLIDNPLFWSGIDHLFVFSQASADGTDEWLTEYQANHPDKPMTVWQSWQNRMAIGGRQRMIDRMIGWGLQADDAVIMLDDDMMCISPEWSQRLVQPLRDDTKVGAVGVQGYFVGFGEEAFNDAPTGEVDVVNGGWTAYRGQVFLEGVEFDQQYYPFWHCDSDLAMQIREKGYKIISVGPVGLAHAAHHPKVTNLWEERRQIFVNKWQGKGLTRNEILRTKKVVRTEPVTITDKSKVLTVYAPAYDPYDGYGRMALEMIHWLSNEQGVHINALGSQNQKILYGTQTVGIQKLLQKPIVASFGGMLLGYPTLHKKYGALAQHGTRVALTMFESDKLPDGWVEALNECQAVIVPTKLNKKIFEKNGVTRPIHVVPLGISETFTPPGVGQRAVRQPPTEEKPFIFLCWGDRGVRKGWDVAIKAFVGAFGERKDVRLIIKAREDNFPFDVSNPNIEVMRDDLDEWGLRDLYLRCDCMVFPSRGEGFGLPPREFAATAGPVIATEWWADDIQQWGYRLEYSLTDAWKGTRMEGLGRWAEPSQNHLEKQMLHVFNQDPKIITYMGGRSAIRIRKLYSWKTFAERVWEIWQATGKPVPTIADKREIRRERKRASWQQQPAT